MNEKYNEINNEAVSVSYGVAENFDQLYEMIKGVDFVAAGISSGDAIEKIEGVRAGDIDIKEIPETFDLQDTVRKLLEKESPEQIAA